MGLVGGAIGYHILRLYSRDGRSAHRDGAAYVGTSKVEKLFGPGIWEDGYLHSFLRRSTLGEAQGGDDLQCQS